MFMWIIKNLLPEKGRICVHSSKKEEKRHHQIKKVIKRSFDIAP